MNESWELGLTVVLFALTYAALAWGRVPGLQTDRAGIAWAGAAAMLAFGLIKFEAAVAAIDFATIALLLGMMIVVGALRLSGFFDKVAAWALARVRHPLGLLAITMALSGVLSAILVNDVVCLALTPLVLHLARRMGLDPKPHLVGLALASNIGSVATLTGNPQNMIIGNLSQISYLRFAAKLTPIALVGWVIGFLITAWVFRSSLKRRSAEAASADGNDIGCEATRSRLPEREGALEQDPSQSALIKSLLVTLGAIALFFAGARMEVVALGAAAILLLGRTRPDSLYQEIHGKLLLMFAGLFVVVRAFEVHVVHTWGVEHWEWLKGDPVVALSLVSAALSNLVSNVPAVLLFQSVIPLMPQSQQEVGWLALAMSSTLAGNLTVLGSVANLIVVERSRHEKIEISFWDYFKAGFPVTLVTLLLGVAWLSFARY